MFNKKKLLLLVFLAAIVVFLLLLLLKERTSVETDFEANLRATHKAVDYRARAPYVMFRPKPGVGDVNSFGFRSPEITREKKQNEYRIAMLGGSVVFGGQCDVSSTIVAHLARVLRAHVPELKDRDITFINGGIPSAVSGQELAQLIHHILPLNIDLLIIYDGYLDFVSPFNYDRRPGYPYDYIVEEYRYYKFIGDKKWWDTFISLFDPTLLNKESQQIVRDYYDELGIKTPAYEETIAQSLEIYFRNVSCMLAVAGAHGIKTAVFLQPYSPERTGVVPDRPETSALQKLYAMAGEKFKILVKENSSEKIYWDMAYMGHGKIQNEFTDAVHFSENANRIVAEEMYSVMKQGGMLG